MWCSTYPSVFVLFIGIPQLKLEVPYTAMSLRVENGATDIGYDFSLLGRSDDEGINDI
jgi:hypothetical protein